MTKKTVIVVAALVIAAAAVSCAQAAKNDKDKDKGKTAALQAPMTEQAQVSAPKAQAAEEKKLLINNVQAMQNQEARVMVLQQLLSRETGDLRQMQAVFCDQYKLDIEKWRGGLYRYDDKGGKFVEVKAGPSL